MKIIRTFTMLLAVGLGVMACDENPVSDDRDTVFRLFLSPTVVTNLQRGAANERKITGYAVNRYGEATYTNVTATACNGNLTIRPDTSLLVIEPPTRVIATGVTPGTSCIVFATGSFSDTVRVTVQ